MEIIFFMAIETIYYLFLDYLLEFFGYMFVQSAGILLIVTLLMCLPPFAYMKFSKNRKKFACLSSLYLIALSIIFYIFGKNILLGMGLQTGITNFTVYEYKILFMLFPFTAIFFILLHKLYLQKKKKQLFLVIAFKRIVPIFIVFILSHFIGFSPCLYALAICDFVSIFLVLIRNNS